jgi:hypothetical protein
VSVSTSAAQAHAVPLHLAIWLVEQLRPARTSVLMLAMFMPVPPEMFSVVPLRLRFWLSVFMGARLMLFPPETVRVEPARLRVWLSVLSR